MTNAVGNPMRMWDSLDRVVSSKYDVLHRRTELRVQTGANAEVLAEQTTYGESLATPELTNHRGKVHQVKDGAGVVTNVEYDFKGNLLTAHRQLAAAFSGQLDWSQNVALEAETFVQQTHYDALNRPTSLKTPDQSEILPTYNEAGLLERVEAKIRGAQTATVFVEDIDYDAKGQRERIAYGDVANNQGVFTEYEYDELTFRVKRIKTTRTSDNELLQDLRYHYDAVGNIVEMADLAQDTVTYNNDVMAPVWQYEYDAIYRLIHATGREHAGQNADVQQDAYGFPLVNAPNPNDLQAMRNYAETYLYDQVGNFVEMIHAVANVSPGVLPSWRRRYNTESVATNPGEPNYPLPRPISNRLMGTSLPGDAEGVYGDAYPHDAHGNMLAMPHLSAMEWDFKDQLAHVVKSGAGDVYFTYDASGQRVRKVWVHNGITEERIYLGGFELYRRHENGGVVLERETLHIMDDTRRIAMVETKTIDANVPNLNVVSRTRFQCSNHLGSAMLEVDEFGAVISYEEYHPHGTSAYRATNGAVEVSAKRYRYTGKERDEETGLYYHGARYYACWLGRWTSADPAGMVDGPNLYQYVRGRPVGMLDATGLQANGGIPGLSVSPQSKISADAILKKINDSKILPNWFKGAFTTDGKNRLLVKQSFQFPEGVTDEKNLPQWFRSAIKAINSGDWHMTTGASIPTRSEGDHNDKLQGDFEPNDLPSRGTRTTDILQGETIPARKLNITTVRLMRKEQAGSDENSRFRRPDQGLIVVPNRFRSPNDPTREAKSSDDEFLEALFHELAAHAGQISANATDVGHASKDWRRYPLNEPDYLAQAVWIFFGRPSNNVTPRPATS